METNKKKAIISYIPVIHQGHLDFFEKHLNSEDVILLINGKALAQEIPEMEYLERDLRAISVIHIANWLRAYRYRNRVGIITNLSEINPCLKGFQCAIMPDDDVSAAILGKITPSCPVELEKMFLRWDMKAVLLQHTVDVPKISINELPPGLIEALQNQIEKSVDWWRQTGAIVFDDAGNILIGAYNKHFPNDLALNIFGDIRFNFTKPGQYLDYFSSIHAEAAAVGLAARKGQSLQGLNMLVSDFPCGNCAKLIAMTGIKNLFFLKGYSNVDGQKVIEDAGITITQVLV